MFTGVGGETVRVVGVPPVGPPLEAAAEAAAVAAAVDWEQVVMLLPVNLKL